MAPAGISRRHLLGLLAAGFATACTSTRRERGAALPPPTSAATTATTAAATTTTTSVVAPSAGSDPPFDRVHPMSGFAAFGDFGGGPAQAAVALAMQHWIAAGHRVDALVTTGDNVYDFGEPAKFDAELTKPYRELRAGGRPLWATLGNHDESAGHGAQQLAFLGLPALPYQKDLPGVRFLFLDANRPDDAQATWLQNQLAVPGPTFSVAVFHQPVFSCGLHGRTPAVIEHWYPVLNSGGLSLVLNGHDHEYQRFLTAEGTTFIVTGGGGQVLYPLIPGCDAPEMRAAVVRHHFTGVEVFSDRMEVTAVATDGSVLDSVAIPANLPTPG